MMETNASRPFRGLPSRRSVDRKAAPSRGCSRRAGRRRGREQRLRLVRTGTGVGAALVRKTHRLRPRRPTAQDKPAGLGMMAYRGQIAGRLLQKGMPGRPGLAAASAGKEKHPFERPGDRMAGTVGSQDQRDFGLGDQALGNRVALGGRGQRRAVESAPATPWPLPRLPRPSPAARNRCPVRGHEGAAADPLAPPTSSVDIGCHSTGDLRRPSADSPAASPRKTAATAACNVWPTVSS